MKCANSDSTISVKYKNALGDECTNMPSGAVFTCNNGTWVWTEGNLIRRIVEVNCINLNG